MCGCADEPAADSRLPPASVSLPKETVPSAQLDNCRRLPAFLARRVRARWQPKHHGAEAWCLDKKSKTKAAQQRTCHQRTIDVFCTSLSQHGERDGPLAVPRSQGFKRHRKAMITALARQSTEQLSSLQKRTCHGQPFLVILQRAVTVTVRSTVSCQLGRASNAGGVGEVSRGT